MTYDSTLNSYFNSLDNAISMIETLEANILFQGIGEDKCLNLLNNIKDDLKNKKSDIYKKYLEDKNN